MDRTILMAALAAALAAAAPALALAQTRWSTPQPETYDALCGEPENSECYLRPMTGNAATDGRTSIALHCGSLLSVDGVRGGDGLPLYASVAFAIDGRRQGTYQVGGGLDHDYLSPEATPTLIEALKAGSSLTMTFDGSTVATVPLAGSRDAITALRQLCGEETAPGQAAATRQREYFGDYVATCRPDGGCDASTFSDTPTADGRTFSSSLVLNRLGGPGTAWILSFAGAFEGPVAGTPIQVAVGAETWTLNAGEGYGQIMDHTFFTRPANEQIFAAMRSGSSLDITQTVADGSQQAVRYSLRGLNEAMLWMDALQGRRGEPAIVGVPFGLDEIVPGYEPAQ